MRIQILCIGKCKEDYLQKAASDYKKRLTSYARLELVEIAPAKDDSIEGIIEKEGKRILERIKSDTYLIALDVKGKTKTSTAFARHLDQITTYGRSHITFIIGGSWGLSQELLRQADLRLSFSEMTFPHQLIRILLLEQIYRAFKINRGETYHK